MNGRLGGEGSKGCEDLGSLGSMLVSRVATDEISDLPQAQCTQQERLMRFLPPCLQSTSSICGDQVLVRKIKIILSRDDLFSLEARHRIGQFGNCVAEKSYSATTSCFFFLILSCFGLVFASAFQQCFFTHHAFTTSGVQWPCASAPASSRRT